MSQGFARNATVIDLTADVTGVLPVSNGGSGINTTTPYAVICAGTVATGAYQTLGALGAAGTVLTSNGAGALPSFQAVPGGVADLQDAYDGGNTIATAGGLAVAISTANTINAICLTLTQNDTTNNPVALSITNAGTGNDITGSNFTISKTGTVAGATITGANVTSGANPGHTHTGTSLTVTLDDAYNGGNTIDCDGSPVTITVSDTDNNRVLDLVQNDSSNNPVVMQITNAGTGNDISATNWNAAKTGAITGVSFIIGGNTLDTNEWANLDGVNQTLATTSSPTFANVTISDSGTVNLDPDPASDVNASGIATTLTVDAGTGSTAVGQAYHIDTDGELVDADADGTATMPCTCLALATGTGSRKVLLQGFIRNDAWNWTVGGIIYVSTDPTTTTGLTQTAPAGSGDQVQAVGVATHADRMYFNPSLVLVEVA